MNIWELDDLELRLARSRSGFGACVELNLIGTTAALITAGVVGAAGSVASGAIGAHAASSAAQTQAQAATQAANIQAQTSREALAEQRRQWEAQLRLMAPWLQTGQAGLSQLAYLMGINTPEGAGRPIDIEALIRGGSALTPGATTSTGRPFMGGIPREGGLRPGEMALDGAGPAPPQVLGDGTGGPVPGATISTAPGLSPLINPELGGFGSLSQPFGETFTAPDPNNLLSDPGYRFRLGEGMRLLENSAAARGGLLTGATAQDLTRYGQGMASDEYDRAYGRALGEFQQRYNIFGQEQANLFNRLSTLAGGGQVTAGQLSSAAGDYGDRAAQILINTGNAQAAGINNAAAARASGYVGGANAWTNALGGGTNSLSQMLLLLNPQIRQSLGIGG